ncbi:1-acyl-sn-glycerol-3-phosphate acyltransferase [Magnetovirga frankeli]|uniref:lysophospholipid acyltransferase family protein n=1 Tax=Magnetovirga frankeli TaxID=947516 RepID=UPI001292D372|nr:1-acyl-sn-glycerol-3-phosphate acyltransferase [gamma proteobacterium SS-5]
MTLLRSILYLVCMGVSVALYASLILILSPFLQKGFLSRIATHWGWVNLGLLRFICGLSYEVRGLEKLHQSEVPSIIMVKHQSAWETIALRGLLPWNQAWVLKKELLAYPFFGWALRATGQIAIDRSQGKKALSTLFERGIVALQQGFNVIIFPEGTRTPFGSKGKYHQGGAMLAERSQAQVIPIAHNAGLLWPKGFIIQPGVVQLVIGEPIPTQGLKAREIGTRIEQQIESEMDRLVGSTKH